MGERIGWWAAIAALLACATAQAIPPPWLLEKDKAAAELILIAKTTTSSDVEGGVRGRFRQMKIGLGPIEILKGKLPEAEGDGEQPKIVLIYHKRIPMPGPMQPAVVGGTGQPKVVDGDTALLFLRKRGEEASYGVVCGSFGYIRLDVKTKAELDKLTQRIGWYRKFCERLKEEAVRKAMNGYYDKALLVAGKRLAAHTPKPVPWLLVAGETPDYGKAKAKELVLRGKLVVKNVGKPGVAYVRPPLEYSVKTATRTVRLGPPMDGLFGPLAGKSVEVKGKMQPLQSGSKKRFLLVGWIREVKPPPPPAPPPPVRKPEPEARPAPEA